MGCPNNAILKARPLFLENQRAIAVIAMWLSILWPNKRRPNKDKKSIRIVSALDSKNANPLNAPSVTSPRKVKLNWSVSLPSQKKTIALTSVAAE